MFGPVTLAVLALAACERRPAEPIPAPAPPPPVERPANPLREVEAIAIGMQHGCALVHGRVWCWGWPSAPGGRGGPVELAAVVAGVEDVVELRAGGRQTCARTRDDALFCWGERFVAPGAADPQVAAWNPVTGTPPSSMLPRFHAAPVRVGFDRIASFDVGRAHACAIDATGALGCWGSNANDEIGGYADPDRPHRVFEGATEIDAGPFYTCFGTEAAAPARPRSRAPEPAARRRCSGAPPDVAATGGREYESLADQFGSLACWIDEGRVQCERVGAWAPQDFEIPDFTDVTALALGAYHGCVARADASVWCWGQNNMRELGFEREGGAAQPVPGVAARALGAGPSRTCALTTESTIVCWGDNEHGAAGAEPGERYVSPTVVQAAR